MPEFTIITAQIDTATPGKCGIRGYWFARNLDPDNLDEEFFIHVRDRAIVWPNLTTGSIDYAKVRTDWLREPRNGDIIVLWFAENELDDSGRRRPQPHHWAYHENCQMAMAQLTASQEKALVPS